MGGSNPGPRKLTPQVQFLVSLTCAELSPTESQAPIGRVDPPPPRGDILEPPLHLCLSSRMG